MRLRVVRTLQFVRPARGRPAGHDVYGVDEECDLVVDAELTDVEAYEYREKEKRERQRDPDARFVAVRLGDRVRFVQLGKDVELLPEEGRGGAAARPRSARTAARRPPPER